MSFELLTKKYFPYFISSFCLALLMNSCQLGEPYQPPEVYIPTNWKTHYGPNEEIQAPDNWKTEPACHPSPLSSDQQQVKENQEVSSTPDSQPTCVSAQIFNSPLVGIENWWEVFNDSTLNDLEQQAIQSNYSLWAAMERVTEARALAGIASSFRWPSLTFDPSFSRSGMLIENPITGIGAGQTAAGAAAQNAAAAATSSSSGAQAQIPTIFRFRNTAYTLPFDFAYEVDLWSRLTNAYYASKLRAEAAYDAYLSVLLTLTTDVASNYFVLRGLDRQQVVLEKTIQARQEAFNINLSRYQAGLSVYTDVSRAKEQLYLARADSVDVARQRVLQENILAVLIGTPASLFSLAFNPLDRPPPLIPSGLPSELLYRRPDVAEAERYLAAAHADVGVAYAAFYPSLRLTATLGLESPDLAHLFSWQARLWAVGANVAQTIFNAGRNSANLLFYQASYREALDNYRGQVLVAFRDVEDALINLKRRVDLSRELDQAVQAAEETLELSQIRYIRGLANYLEVTDAERQKLIDQLRADSVLTQRYVDTVMLIKALGGGWKNCQETELKPCQR